MAFYKVPIRPYDPVIEEDQATGAFRYYRDNFSGTGQDSHTRPPAQDQSFWQSLLNIMPTTTGILQRRWGYREYALLNPNSTRLYSFQRDTDALRTIIATGGTVEAILESPPNDFYSAIYTPSLSPLARCVSSRSYAYFYSGQRKDLVKWDGTGGSGTAPIGSPGAGVTGWGIEINNVTSGSTFGPNLPTVAVDRNDNGHPWTNPTNIKLADGTGATFTSFPGESVSDTLQISSFGLAPTGTVLGIQVDVGYKSSLAAPLIISLQKSGTTSIAGTPKTTSILNAGGSYLTQTFGGPNDLWGTYWFPGDLAGADFAANIQVGPNTNPASGQLSTVTLGAQGSYAFDLPSVSLSGGGGTGGRIDITSYTTSSSGGVHPTTLYHITGLKITNAGSGYSTAPTIVFSPTGAAQATATCTITSAGPTPTVNLDWARVTVTTIPGAGITLGGAFPGVVNLTVGRTYYQAFLNPSTGHFSDLSPASASTGPLTNQEQQVFVTLSNDPQVSLIVLLATADGGDPSILYQVAQIPNSIFSTSYVDNIPEETLVLNQQLLFTDSFGNDFGIAGNSPPPVGTLAIKHKGRLWMAQGQNLYFSKSVGELTLPNGYIAGKYEESWPSDNFFDISEGAETISGLLSDGNVLYIGTQNHVRRLFGDDPTNFQEPEIVHAQVGVINQDVWQIVYLEGAPSGAIWMTPDFRVMGSDFNSYTDIGSPVQDILNSLQPNAASLAHAMFVADGEYNLYILAVPVNSTTACDVHLVYDIKNHLWFVWKPNIPSKGMLYVATTTGTPLWLFIGNDSTLYQYTSQVFADNGTSFTATAQTSWMHFGVPSKRKLLDDLEIIGDPAMAITVEGASTQGDFLSPNTLASNAALAQSPFGQNKIYLASAPCNDRYYRITFTSLNNLQDFLDAYNLRIIPFNAL